VSVHTWGPPYRGPFFMLPLATGVADATAPEEKEMGCRTLKHHSYLSLCYPLQGAVQATFLRISEDAARTVRHLTDPASTDAHHAALAQLNWLVLTLRRILTANQLALDVVSSVSQPTTSPKKDSVRYATPKTNQKLDKKLETCCEKDDCRQCQR